MESIKIALFENPLPIYIALVPLDVIFLIAFLRRRTLRRGLLLAVPSVLAGIVSLTVWLVPTDRKAIFSAATAICADIQAGRKDALETYLDGKFSGVYRHVPLDKQGAIGVAKSGKETMQITQVLLLPQRSTIEVQGARAHMIAVTNITGTDEYLGSGGMSVTFDLIWVKGPDGVWRILESKDLQ